MTFPDVAVSPGRAGALLAVNPGQIDVLHEVSQGGDALSRELAAVDCGHVFLGRIFDVGWWTFAPCGYVSQAVGHALLLNSPVDVSPLPIANIPAATNSNDLTFLHLASFLPSISADTYCGIHACIH